MNRIFGRFSSNKNLSQNEQEIPQSEISEDELDNSHSDFVAESCKLEDAPKKALEINLESAYSYVSRGIVYKKQGELELALDDYNKAIEINPEYANAYLYRGYLYHNQGELELALADYNKAIEINPEYADAYNNRGLLYNNQGELELALADYNKAIEINPKLAEQLAERLEQLEHLKQYNEELPEGAQD